MHAFALLAEVPALHSALVEPFAVGLHAANVAEIAAGDDVLVIGAGGVGLTAVAWASALGGARLTVVDPNDARRSMALSLGADETLTSLAEVESSAYDVIVECVGRPELIADGAAAARPRGRIVVAGVCDVPVTIEPIAALLHELSFRWSVAYRPYEFKTVIDAFASGRVDPQRVIGATVSLQDLAGAFDAVRTTATNGRVLVDPSV